MKQGTTQEDVLTEQVNIESKTSGLFYGNTQFLVFKPSVNTKNNQFDSLLAL